MNAGERQIALERARQGDRQALDALLDSYRPYVRVMVRGLHDGRLRAKLDESDLIQDALLAAHRSFTAFRGRTMPEFLVWLRQVALRTTQHSLRTYLQTGKRDVGLEQSAEFLAELAASSSSSPSNQAIRHEQAARMAEALARLPDDMQQVLLGRHMDGVSYADLAAQLQRSEGAVRVLYTRALRKLREECGEVP